MWPISAAGWLVIHVPLCVERIIGHESEAINRHYTHIETATKRAALRKLPKLL